MKKDIEKAYRFYIEKTGKDITIEEFLENIQKLDFDLLFKSKVEDTKDILKDLAGGKKDIKRDTAALIAALTIMMPSGPVDTSAEYKNWGGFSGFSAAVMAKSAKSNENDISTYIYDEKISEAEEIVVKIIKKYMEQGLELSEVLDKVSSYRELDIEQVTEVEKILDNAVKNGDLPIKSFTAEELDYLKSKYRPKGGNSPTYIFVNNDYDALDLQFHSKSGAIVQIASQFNALESTSPYFHSVKRWFSDKTQGPMASLQSISACKHRESAALLGKLPDAIKDIVNSFTVKKRYGFLNLFKKDIPITEKYENFYQGGYLNLYKIGEDNLENLIGFAKHINRNKSKIKINSQWVRCEKTGNKQLQVFCSGPSFQGGIDEINWNDDKNARVLAMKNICIDLVVEQYKAIAQIAAIKSVLSGKQEELHLYMVGQGVFRNPPEVMALAIKAVARELAGYDVKVYLHKGYLKTNNKWEDICADNEIKSLLGNKVYRE